MGALRTLTFHGTCPARSEVTLVSGRIPVPFAIHRVRAHFPAGCINLLALRLYSSEEPTAPTTGSPTGLSLLGIFSQVDYLVGEGETKDMEQVLHIPESGTWLKVYAVNTDYYDHSVDVQVTIEINPATEA